MVVFQEGNREASRIHHRSAKRTAPMQPQKLAEDLEALNTKPKKMMPNEVGVPVGEVPNGSVSGMKQAGFQDSSQKHTKLHLCQHSSMVPKSIQQMAVSV